MAITVNTDSGQHEHPDGVDFRIDPTTATLAVLGAEDATVAVYAPGCWANARVTEQK